MQNCKSSHSRKFLEQSTRNPPNSDECLVRVMRPSASCYFQVLMSYRHGFATKTRRRLGTCLQTCSSLLYLRPRLLAVSLHFSCRAAWIADSKQMQQPLFVHPPPALPLAIARLLSACCLLRARTKRGFPRTSSDSTASPVARPRHSDLHEPMKWLPLTLQGRAVSLPSLVCSNNTIRATPSAHLCAFLAFVLSSGPRACDIPGAHLTHPVFGPRPSPAGVLPMSQLHATTFPKR